MHEVAMPTRGAKAADGCPKYLQARETGLGEKDHTADTTLDVPGVAQEPQGGVWSQVRLFLCYLMQHRLC